MPWPSTDCGGGSSGGGGSCGCSQECGTAQLVPSGTSAVASVTITGLHSLTTQSAIILTYNTPSGSSTRVSAPLASRNTSGGSFVIEADNPFDSGTVDWSICNVQQHGTAKLTAGTVTIYGAGLTATSRILLSYNNAMGSAVYVSAPDADRNVALGEFIIIAANVFDTSTVDWAICNT